MRALLTNMGSVGDVMPLFALARELERAGHRATLALPPFYRARVEAAGLPFVPIGPDLDFPEIDRRDTARLVAGEDPARVMAEAAALLADMLPRMLEELLAAGARADVVVSGHLQPAAQMVHELTGLPYVSMQLNHFGGSRAPAERAAVAAVINPFRARHGLPSQHDPMHSDANSSQLALYAVSRHVGMPRADWPDHYRLTGFWFLDGEDFAPGGELREFLGAGEPPVAFSFSSMTHADPAALTDLLLEATQRAGCRAILQHGWSGLAKRRLPEHALGLGFVPHAWLFPRCAAVVHHCGSQTTAAVLRAGVPALALPHVRDQPLWAHMIYDLGTSVRPLPFHRLTVDRLADALQQTLESSDLALRARRLGEKIRAERGTETARRAIESLLQQLGATAPAEVSAAATARRQDRRSRRRRLERTRRRGRTAERTSDTERTDPWRP